jgi:hypothetical protein
VLHKELFVCLSGALFALGAHAAPYEIKGIAPGTDVSTVDLKACTAVKNADSGVPGYRCNTTYGGAPAVMTVVVANQKVIAVKVLVEGQVMTPVRDALQEKYGPARQPNRYIESYQWQSGPDYLEIEERRVGGGYSAISINFDLYHAVSDTQKSKAKTDL